MDSILADGAVAVVEALGTEAVKESALIWGVKEDLKDLEQTLSTIKAVLRDAEKRRFSEEGVRNWLERLEDAVNDAENLHDDVSYQALQKRFRKACNLLSLPKGFIFWCKVAHRIKAIRRRLTHIDEDKKKFLFQLNQNAVAMGAIAANIDRETHSYVEEGSVIGREREKMEIVELLLSTGVESETKEGLSVIPIVGIGGLGKTTLAQQVYNDPSVMRHFQLRIWVYVSQDFSVRSIVEKIVQSVEQHSEIGSLDQLQRKLREEILSSKRYLLVLDDVWNDDLIKWRELETLLKNGQRGCKILLTTRHENVARITGTGEPYRLRNLDEQESWDLFKRIAVVRGEERNDPSKIHIGKEIARKCYGIPLVVKSIASVLVTNPEIVWLSFKEEFSSVPQSGEDILPTLKLSYDYLPSNMKRCFAFLSLYPKGYEIDKIMLIDNWLAQGLVVSSSYSSHEQPIEEVALQCFEGLVSRSFLEYDRGYHGQYKMHDLIHDLAAFVAGKRCAILRKDTDRIDETSTRHVSLVRNDLDTSLTWQIPSSLVQAKMIQSIILPTESNFIIINRRFEPSFYEEILSKFKFLRSLDLHDSGMETVPQSIAKLKHLKTLDLSRNTQLKMLPDSIRKLLNLQSLNLTSCFRLEKLPRGLSQLVNLRNLRLDYCHELSCLPSGLGQLSSLQTLSRLVLREDEHSAKIDDLMNLNSLKGGLEIRNLRHGMKTEGANFREKRYLQSLSLFWGTGLDHGVSMDVVDHETTLRGVRNIPSLKEFLLHGYGGVGIPDWLPFTNLVKLKLVTMPHLEYVTSTTCESSTSPTFVMPSLKELRLENLPNLKGWWRDMVNAGTGDQRDYPLMLPSFPLLETFYIVRCPLLKCIPLFPYLSYKLYLKNTNLEALLIPTLEAKQTPKIDQEASSSASSTTSFTPLSQLQFLRIKVDNVEHLPDYLRNLTSVNHLQLTELPRLKSLSPGIQHFASLTGLWLQYCEQLDLCDDNVWQSLGRITYLRLEGLPQLVILPQGVQHVTSLQSLIIAFCHNFANLPEWICTDFKQLSRVDVLECPNLTSFPKVMRAEITSETDWNYYELNYIKERFRIPPEKEGYHCIPIPKLSLHLQSNKSAHNSQRSSSSSSGVEWQYRHPVWETNLITN